MNTVPRWLTSLTDWGWHVNLQAAFLVICIVALSFLPRTLLTTRWRSLLWTIVFIRLAIPFTFPSTTSAQNLFEISSPRDTSLPVSFEPSDQVATTAAIDVHTAQRAHVNELPVAVDSGISPWRMRDIVGIVWVSVAIVLLLRLCWLSFSQRRFVMGLNPVDDANVNSLAAECADLAGLSRVPPIREGPAETGPAIAGWLRPVLLLPRECIVGLSEAQLRLVLLHEFRHVTSYDTVVSWFQHLLKAIYWFNPAVWIAQHNWRVERELACDSWVLSVAGQASHRTYAETLLSIVEYDGASKPLMLTAGMIPFPSLLERRIRAMRNFTEASRRSFVFGLVAVLLLSVTGLTDQIRGADDGKAETTATKKQVDKKPNPEAAQKKKEVRHPTIIFAKHVVLWESREVLTWEQMLGRLKDWRKDGRVLPRLYQTSGHAKDADGKFNNSSNKILEAVGSQEYTTMSFVQGVKTDLYDSIRTQADLDRKQGTELRGKLTLPSSAAAAGAQIVVLPKGRWGNLNLNPTTFASAVDEVCSYATESGEFKLHVDAAEYYLAFFHKEGYQVVKGPLRDGAEYILQPWQTVTFTTKDWPDDQKAEVWIRPEGTSAPCPGFSLAWLHGKNRTVTLKVPVGKGKTTQLYSSDGGGAITGGNTRLVIRSGESQKIALPAMTDEQRAAGKKKWEDFISEAQER